MAPRREDQGGRAFVHGVAEAYVRRASTRRVEGLVETPRTASLSKSQVSVMAKELDERADDFRDRPLDRGPYLWADALMNTGSPTSCDAWCTLFPQRR